MCANIESFNTVNLLFAILDFKWYFVCETNAKVLNTTSVKYHIILPACKCPGIKGHSFCKQGDLGLNWSSTVHFNQRGSMYRSGSPAVTTNVVPYLDLQTVDNNFSSLYRFCY